MAKFRALMLWTDAWIADTAHLTRLERGTYHDLLVLMWRTPGCRVPNDDAWLAKRLHMSDDEVAGELRPLIREFCRSDGNWIWQKRLKKEMAWSEALSESQSVKAKLRWEKEKGECNGTDNDAESTFPGWFQSQTVKRKPLSSNDKDQCRGNASVTVSVSKKDIPTANAVGADAPPDDPRTRLFRSGLRLVIEMTGKTEDSARSLLGRWLKAADDNAVDVLAALQDAHRNRIADPVAWITAGLTRKGKPNGHHDQRGGFARALGELADAAADAGPPAGGPHPARFLPHRRGQ